MIWAGVLVVLGLVLLVVGGDLLVRGACGIALLARVAPAVVGLTIVAAGTSMPELVVSLQAALRGSPDLAVGNVVGSNIFNVAAILGIAALIHPLRIEGNTVRLEWPVMFLASFQLVLLARDGVVDRLEGGFLLAGMLAFTAYVVWIARRNARPAEKADFSEMTTASFGRTGQAALVFNAVAILAGVGLLIGGASALVSGAVELALGFGVSEAMVGLTVVAAGTSLPELAASTMAAWRGRDDIAVANVVGSNIFNILGILGPTALITPTAVTGEIIHRDLWWMLGSAVLLFPLMRSGMRINRTEGVLLIATFVGWLTTVVHAQITA
ncbi:MAG: calcium/sodium antiporter [bacterium]